jgi:hypothetical protein
VSILKVTDGKNRIRSRIRIRLRLSKDRGSVSGSVPKCHGSGTLRLHNARLYRLQLDTTKIIIIFNSGEVKLFGPCLMEVDRLVGPEIDGDLRVLGNLHNLAQLHHQAGRFLVPPHVASNWVGAWGGGGGGN